MADLFSLLTGDEPSAQARAEALARAMRQRQGFGMLGQLSGDRVIAPVGQSLAQGSAQAPGQIAQVMNQRQGRLLTREQMAQQKAQQDAQLAESSRHNLAAEALTRTGQAQDAWSAIADPVTGGIVMFNKKTGERMPLGPGGGMPGAGTPTGLPNLPGKPTEKQRNEVSLANENMAKLDMALKALDENPGSYGGVGNYVAGLADMAGGTPAQAITSRRLEPGEIQSKNFITNVVSEIITQRAGTNVTLREELRQKFLPNEMDSIEAARQKLKDLREFEVVTYRTQGGGSLPTPPPTAKRKALGGKNYEQRDGKWFEVD